LQNIDLTAEKSSFTLEYREAEYASVRFWDGECLCYEQELVQTAVCKLHAQMQRSDYAKKSILPFYSAGSAYNGGLQKFGRRNIAAV